jgi:hypothetical protein
VISGEEESDRRDPPVSEREGERIPLRVLTPGGPWADSDAGPDGFPGSIFYFYFFSSLFPFSGF